MPAQTKLAQCIARQEGWGKPGTVPTIRHNPGDLRHSPHSEHPDDPEAIGTIDTDADGWDDLERQLRLYAERGLTLQEMIKTCYAPPNENNSDLYLWNVCGWMGMSGYVPVSEALKVPAMDWDELLRLGKIYP